MKIERKTGLCLLGLATFVIGGQFAADTWRGERLVSTLIPAPDGTFACSWKPETNSPEYQRYQQRLRDRHSFDAIWKARFERDITPEIVACLKAPNDLHESSIRALGRLATSEAERALINFGADAKVVPLDSAGSYSINGVSLPTYQMVLARAQSRGQHS